jgi:transcriptional regulator with XRE-family HTH domain
MEHSFDQGVGAEIKRLREEREWSMAKLAVEADMSVSGVSMIENGKRNLTTTTLAKLARAFGVEVRDLFPLAQTPLPDLDYKEGFDAWVATLKHYESMRGRIFDFSKLEWRERRRVLDEALDLFLELRMIYNFPHNRQDREIALLHDVLYQSVLRMVEAFEREQERGDADVANIVNIEEYKAHLRQSA